MSYIPALYGKIDTNNSTSTPLTANSVFTGTSTDILNYASGVINLTTDRDSAVNGFAYQYSSDNTNWDIIKANSITISNPGTAFDFTFPLAIKARYFRIVYTNGPTTQGVFRLQILFNSQGSSQNLFGVIDGIGNEQKSLMCSYDGNLNVNIANGLSAFGDLRTTELTPLIQFDFVYGLNTNFVTSAVATGGTATATNQMAVMTTTSASGSSSSVSSNKYFKYRDGMGGLARLTAIFNTGVANNIQIAGCGDDTDGYFFGYNGASFGVLYRRNAVNTWISQANWNGDTMLGTGGNSNPSKYLLVPTNGNIFQISIGYLGFANPKFFIYNPYTSSFVLVHTHIYAGLNTVPLVINPSLTLWWKTSNSAASTATTLRAGSGGMFIDGTPQELGPKYGRTSTIINPGVASRNIISLRNNTTINGITNKSQIKVTQICFSATDTTAANLANTIIINFVIGATVGGTPVFTNINATNSIAAFDVAGTTVTGGTIVQSYSSCFGSSFVVDLSSYNILLYPGNILTLASTMSASAGTTKVNVSINWSENT